MTTKAKILYNLERAYIVLEAVPPAKFYLNAFRQEGECGTLFCAAGHLTTVPFFRKFMVLEQMRADPSSWSLKPVQEADIAMVRYSGHRDWLDNHFGPNAYYNCFSSRNNGGRDMLHPQVVGNEDEEDGYPQCVSKDVNDKDLALWRLLQQIEAVKAWPDTTEGAKA